MSHHTRDPVTHHILAISAVFCVMVAFFALLFVSPPEGNRDSVNLVLGALLTVGFTSVFTFYFGSSQGERGNRDQLNRQADKLAEAAATATVAAATVPVAVPSGLSVDGTVTLAPGENVKVEAAAEEPEPEPDPTMFGGPRG